MQIRKMIDQDLDFALQLTSSEGWSSTRLDFEELLQFDPDGCYIAEVDGKPVAMVCSSPYDGFGFISNLIVDREYRCKQYGTILMNHIIDYLENRGIRTQLLDGVIKAVPLYERLGCVKKHRSMRLEGTVKPKESLYVRHMISNDLEVIDRFDTDCFGAPREKFLHSRFRHFPTLAKVLEVQGEIIGYIMGSESGDIIRIGPWVMRENLDLAEELLTDFAMEVEEKNLKIGVVENNVRALSLLQKHQFKEIGFSWRMLRGIEGDWALSDHLYAICCAARG
ncbi:GNAT family N-acetyltransferase [Candidatus Thorarchaeota archaeon]|nr:MAG: GNAT family N-acetyltransferase [Candidatus Thorarchaeota archaeon]